MPLINKQTNSNIVDKFFERYKPENTPLSLSEIHRQITDIERRVSDSIFPHHYTRIVNAAYTVDGGIVDWIKTRRTTLRTSKIRNISGIYRLTWISNEQFNIVAGNKTYSGGTAMLIFDDTIDEYEFNAVAVNETTLRMKIIWCLEFVFHMPHGVELH